MQDSQPFVQVPTEVLRALVAPKEPGLFEWSQFLAPILVAFGVVYLTEYFGDRARRDRAFRIALASWGAVIQRHMTLQVSYLGLFALPICDARTDALRENAREGREVRALLRTRVLSVLTRAPRRWKNDIRRVTSGSYLSQIQVLPKPHVFQTILIDRAVSDQAAQEEKATLESLEGLINALD